MLLGKAIRWKDGLLHACALMLLHNPTDCPNPDRGVRLCLAQKRNARPLQCNDNRRIAKRPPLRQAVIAQFLARVNKNGREQPKGFGTLNRCADVEQGLVEGLLCLTPACPDVGSGRDIARGVQCHARLRSNVARIAFVFPPRPRHRPVCGCSRAVKVAHRIIAIDVHRAAFPSHLMVSME